METKRIETLVELEELLKTHTITVESMDALVDRTCELVYENFERNNGFFLPYKDKFMILVDGNYDKRQRGITVMHEALHAILWMNGFNTVNRSINLLTGEGKDLPVSEEHGKIEAAIDREAEKAYEGKKDTYAFYLGELRKLNRVSVKNDLNETTKNEIWDEIQGYSGEKDDKDFWAKRRAYKRERARRRGG